MKEFLNRFLRPCRKITDQFFIGFFLAFLLTGFGQLLGKVICARLSTLRFGPTGPVPAWFETGRMYFEFIGIWILMILVMVIFPKNREMLEGFGTKFSGNTPKMALLGCVIGFCTNVFCVVMSILLKDLSISFSEFNIGIFLFLLLTVFVQSAAEEIVMRMYYYEKLRRRYRNPIIALLFSSVAFSAMHVGNPNMTTWGLVQIVIIGFLFAVLVHYYNSTWAAFWVHASWNFTQSILLGLPNSGVVVPYSNFKINAASTGFFFDAGNGVEGSPGACIVMGIILVLLVVYAKKHNLQPHDRWEKQEAEADALAAEYAAKQK